MHKRGVAGATASVVGRRLGKAANCPIGQPSDGFKTNTATLKWEMLPPLERFFSPSTSTSTYLFFDTSERVSDRAKQCASESLCESICCCLKLSVPFYPFPCLLLLLLLRLVVCFLLLLLFFFFSSSASSILALFGVCVYLPVWVVYL